MSAEQLPLLPQRPSRARPGRHAAAQLPVARVAVLTPVPHLDRPFDYEVPEALSDTAVPGARVRVRLAGRLVDGFVLERVAGSAHPVQPLRSVHGPPVLTGQVVALCREVADRYAGTLADVLRFAVPPRHARVEREEGPPGGSPAPGAPVDVPAPAPPSGPTAGLGGAARPPGAPPELSAPEPAAPTGGGWARYDGGALLLGRIGAAQPVRAVWASAPGEQVAARVAELVAAVAARGRGAIVVAPDAADVERLSEGLRTHPAGPVDHVTLTAQTGPQARYRAFLRILSGRFRVVVGTRAAVFAPVPDLGALIVWDDADGSLAEPQAPGWHAREVAALRSAREAVSLVLAGPSVSLEAARMAHAGWLARVALARPDLRAAMPRVQVAADVTRGDPAVATRDRIPPVALQVLRDGVARGPVLVSVPRAGYLPVLACQDCREPVACPRCGAPMRADGPERRPTCVEHGTVPQWRCPLCGGQRVRASVVGVRRTAEEFGRALPGVPVVSSSGESPVRRLQQPRGLVVATPGAEPDPGPAGYAALVLLDVDATLSRPGLRTPEEVLRRWLRAAAAVRCAPQGGQVLVVGQPGAREVQALVRWDPFGYALRELDERRSLHLPPAVRTALLVGPASDCADLADRVCAELGERVLRRSGPLPAPRQASGGHRASPPGMPSGGHRASPPGTAGEPGTGTLVDAGRGGGPEPPPEPAAWLLAVALSDGTAMAGALARAQTERSARRRPVVTVRVDPPRLP